MNRTPINPWPWSAEMYNQGEAVEGHSRVLFMAGQTATTWEDPTGEERDVVVQVAPSQRTSIEDLASLRAMPVMTLIRPADANETAEAWRLAIGRNGPTALALTRQASC